MNYCNFEQNGLQYFYIFILLQFYQTFGEKVCFCSEGTAGWFYILSFNFLIDYFRDERK